MGNKTKTKMNHMMKKQTQIAEYETKIKSFSNTAKAHSKQYTEEKIRGRMIKNNERTAVRASLSAPADSSSRAHSA
jgi:hypothetical protein